MGDHGDETRPAPAPHKKAYEAWRRICIGLRGPLLVNKISDQIGRYIPEFRVKIFQHESWLIMLRLGRFILE
jgi:hypothetical protein